MAPPLIDMSWSGISSSGSTSKVVPRPSHDSQAPYGELNEKLRGAGSSGLCRNDVRDRLVAQVPDVTRLLDRLEEAELVSRERDTVDRRLVTTRITKHGLALLARLDQPVEAAHKKQLGHMSSEQLRTLIDLLAIVRSSA